MNSPHLNEPSEVTTNTSLETNPNTSNSAVRDFLLETAQVDMNEPSVSEPSDDFTLEVPSSNNESSTDLKTNSVEHCFDNSSTLVTMEDNETRKRAASVSATTTPNLFFSDQKLQKALASQVVSPKHDELRSSFVKPIDTSPTPQSPDGKPRTCEHSSADDLIHRAPNISLSSSSSVPTPSRSTLHSSTHKQNTFTRKVRQTCKQAIDAIRKSPLLERKHPPPAGAITKSL